MKFAYKLQELRKGCGMSQEEFAELLGVSRQSVSKWESGKGYPEIDKLIFISNYFNTSLDLLLKDTQEPSIPISTRSTRVSKKRKGNIKLTKPNDIQPPLQETPYVSDPLPSPKKENLSLRRVSVSPNAQVRPTKNHSFDYNTIKKHRLSSKGKIAIAITSFCIAMISTFTIIGISMSNSYDDYADIETTYYVTATYDTEFDEMSNIYYSSDWKNLYDNDFTSDIENGMMKDMNYQLESVLTDANGNVYISGYDVVNTYYNAQTDMKNELMCSQLYQKYVSLQNSNNYIDIYSYDINQWVLMPKTMINTYPDGSPYNLELYEMVNDGTYPVYDILSEEASVYMDYSVSPFEKVFRVNKQSGASVSQSILDMSLDAMNDRKLNLNVENYCKEYEHLNSKMELVSCTERSGKDNIFVPKEFIMVNVSEFEESQGDNTVLESTLENTVVIDEQNAEAVQEDIVVEENQNVESLGINIDE